MKTRDKNRTTPERKPTLKTTQDYREHRTMSVCMIVSTPQMSSDAGDTTQQPSLMASALPSTRPSGRASPVQGLMPPPNGPTLAPLPSGLARLQHPQQPPQGPPNDERSVVPKITMQDMKDQSPYIFNLRITAIQTTATNYDPQRAISNLNATLQDALATKSGVEDIPMHMYRVVFEHPAPTGGSKDTINYGKFICQVPGPMESYVADLTDPEKGGELQFTGDGAGNNYKLAFEAYVAPENKEKRREPNEKQWFHVIPLTKNGITSVPQRLAYERTAGHIANFGMTIMDHEDAFKARTTNDKEQAKPGWHVEYNVDYGRIPLDRSSRYDVRDLKEFYLDPETRERAKIWIRPDLLRMIFGACHVCWKNQDNCDGHDPKQPSGAKRTSAAEQDQSAKLRMQKKAKQNFGF